MKPWMLGVMTFVVGLFLLAAYGMGSMSYLSGEVPASYYGEMFVPLGIMVGGPVAAIAWSVRRHRHSRRSLRR